MTKIHSTHIEINEPHPLPELGTIKPMLKSGRIHTASFNTRRRKFITINGWGIIFATITLMIIGAVWSVW